MLNFEAYCASYSYLMDSFIWADLEEKELSLRSGWNAVNLSDWHYQLKQLYHNHKLDTFSFYF